MKLESKKKEMAMKWGSGGMKYTQNGKETKFGHGMKPKMNGEKTGFAHGERPTQNSNSHKEKIAGRLYRQDGSGSGYNGGEKATQSNSQKSGYAHGMKPKMNGNC